MTNDDAILKTDIGRTDGPAGSIRPEALPPLPPPYTDWKEPDWTPPHSAENRDAHIVLDDTTALSLPRPAGPAEERAQVAAFLSGLEKLFGKKNNWAFLKPLLLSIDHCTRCQTCSESCHVFLESGKNHLYRPSFRSEILRQLYRKHRSGGGFLSRPLGGEIQINWTTLAHLAELAYRCNLCRRCTQACPLGVDNGLIAREIRKLFSMEMGIAPKELHRDGTLLQLAVGSSTGMGKAAVIDNMAFIDEDVSERTGITVTTPWDKSGADVLLIHNAGEILSWPENPGAFALILQAAGISWTLSSDAIGYDAVNYGLWYDDVQLMRLAERHVQAAKKLGVKKIVIGECGHAHKALMVIIDRLLTKETSIPRESSLTLMDDIVQSGRLSFDPLRNNFPVTLHDPCSLVRLMGIVEPQRRILRAIAPRFREMTPQGVNNFCCGGGSGLAIMTGNNFEEWRCRVSGRRKFRQILQAFQDDLDPTHPKYVCAPCSNCKGQMRSILAHYDAWARVGIHYGGLVELMVNAMTDVKPDYIDFSVL